MNTATMIIAGILFAIAVVYMTRKWYLHDRERYTRQWVERVESMNDDKALYHTVALRTFTGWEDFGHWPLRDQAREQAALRKLSEACERYETKIREEHAAALAIRYQEEARRRALEWAKLKTPWGRAEYCIQGCSFYHNDQVDTNIAYGTPREEMGALFTALMEDTLRQARSGNALALRGYMIVMEHGLRRQFCRDYEAGAWDYPTDWNDLVVTLIEAPVLSDFKHVPDWAVAEVGLRAAEALRTQDFKLAKLVLAHCNVARGMGHDRQLYPFRDAVGDVMLDQLHRMVEAMHLEKKLFRQKLEA